MKKHKHNSELRTSNSEIQYTPPYTVSGKAMNLIAEIAANNFSLAISLYAHAASIRSSECGALGLDDAIEEWKRAANQTVDALDDFKLLVEGR